MRFSDRTLSKVTCNSDRYYSVMIMFICVDQLSNQKIIFHFWETYSGGIIFRENISVPTKKNSHFSEYDSKIIFLSGLNKKNYLGTISTTTFCKYISLNVYIPFTDAVLGIAIIETSLVISTSKLNIQRKIPIKDW